MKYCIFQPCFQEEFASIRPQQYGKIYLDIFRIGQESRQSRGQHPCLTRVVQQRQHLFLKDLLLKARA